MNPRKLHISPGLLMGIVALLVVGCLLMAVGVSFARYRDDLKGDIQIQPEQPAEVYLGCVAEGTFVNQQSAWTEIDGKMQLSFAVSNGIAQDSFSQQDQQARLRIVASLGAWSESTTDTIYLTVDGQTYTAVAERIPEGSALHTQFGDGWILRFQDAQGEEPVWTLPAEQWSYISMLMYFDAAAIPDTSLLQLQVIVEAG